MMGNRLTHLVIPSPCHAALTRRDENDAGSDEQDTHDERSTEALLQKERGTERDDDDAESLEWKEVAEIELLQQADIEKEGDGHAEDAREENPRSMAAARVAFFSFVEAVQRHFQKQLTRDEGEQGKQDDEN